MKLITMILFTITIFSGCGADDPPQLSKEEIAEYAKQQSSDILYDHYTKSFKGKIFKDVSVSNHNYWFESDITLHVSCVVFYTVELESNILGTLKNRGETQYTLTFQVDEAASTIEQSTRFVNINPPL